MYLARSVSLEQLLGMAPPRRSAGVQPAVSPISNRHNVAITAAPGLSRRPQAGSTAIQQVGNLRYEGGPFRSLTLCGRVTNFFGSAMTKSTPDVAAM